MITPSDSPSAPEQYSQVAVQPVNIQAPLADAEITAAFNEAIALGGSGVLYPMSERISQAKAMLESPQGFGSGGFSVTGGFHGGDGPDGWPANPEPPHAGP
jgi:hypothetical protein